MKVARGPRSREPATRDPEKDGAAALADAAKGGAMGARKERRDADGPACHMRSAACRPNIGFDLAEGRVKEVQQRKRRRKRPASRNGGNEPPATPPREDGRRDGRDGKVHRGIYGKAPGLH